MAKWQEHLKSIGMTDAQIAEAEKVFGADVMARAIEAPIAAAAKAQADLQQFTTFYEETAKPEISKVYQDAINATTENAALKARLKAAKDYGFLGDVDGDTAVAAVPGSPAVGGNRAPAAGDLDSRYVTADAFNTGINGIPDALARLTKISNEHFSLYGTPLLDVEELMTEARTSKKNIRDVWETKYNVAAKRQEKADAVKAAEREKIRAEVRTELTSQMHNPFTRTPALSTNTKFGTGDDARKPWLHSKDRQIERRNTLLNSLVGAKTA